MELSPVNSTRLRFVEAALTCFAAHGYAGVGIRQIAAATASNSSLIYYHFGNKSGLYREVLQHVLACKGRRIAAQIGLLAVGPGMSRQEVIQGLTTFIKAFLEVLVPSEPAGSPDEAAATLLCRELESPTPHFDVLVTGVAIPVARYLDRVVGVLRPDLNEAGRFSMGLSITGQLLYFRNALDSLRLLRGDPAWPRELGPLVRHFSEFSLRGLGLAEGLDLLHSSRLPL